MKRRRRLLYFRQRNGRLESRRLYVADWRSADEIMGWIGFTRDPSGQLF
jgi:hypothetical protein